MNRVQLDSGSREARLGAIAARQRGLITQCQANEAGLSADAISWRVKRGDWIRVLPGVYRLASVTADPWQLARAATLWAGDGAVVSHESAGAVWRVSGVRAERVEIWTPRRLRSGVVVVHQGVIEPRDRRMVDGIPVTSAARTIVDLAGRLDDEALDTSIDDVLHRGLTAFGKLLGTATGMESRGRAGAARLRDLLEAYGDGPASESRLETRVRRLLYGAGLRPVRQHEVVVGDRRYRLDFAWPRARVAVEPDGWAVHGGRAAFERDRRRWADLTAAGWRLIPVTWREVTRRPDDFLDRVRAALEVHAEDAAGARDDGGGA